MKKIIRLMVFVFIGVLCIGALGSCNKEKDPDQPDVDYSKLTFAEVFEIIDWDKPGDGGMPGMTMAQLTSGSSSSAYPAKIHHVFYLKAKYDVEIKGVSFSMKPEKAVNFIYFAVAPSTAIGSPIFITGSEQEHNVEPISSGANEVNKNYSFSHTLKKGNSLYFNSILREEEDRFYVNATFYNFKLNFTVVQK